MRSPPSGSVDGAETDLEPLLEALALGSPQALFVPVSDTVATSIVQLAPGVDGLGDMLLITGDGLIDEGFMEQPETEGMFFSGPEIHFGDNRNESTGMSASAFAAIYEDRFETPPVSAFWGHAYDATTLLLEAIEAASVESDGQLVIDREAVRQHLNGVAGFEGIIGTISCDEFGDCGVPLITVIEHLDSDDVAASRDNSVFEYSPQG